MEHTLIQTRSYRDCLPNQYTAGYLAYCRRTDGLLENSEIKTCHTGDRVTFKELQAKNVSADTVLQWRIPVDVADLYGAFLANKVSKLSMAFICNCSSSKIFGRYCEYQFEEGIHSLADLLNSTVEEKKNHYPQDRLLPCYELDTSDERCLDYRDICDRELDTIDGEDERYCDQLETNFCDSDQFRCRNGLCIARQFFFDGGSDCTDWSDEQNLLVQKKYHQFQYCYEQATFDCDEHWCGREMLSCGDGECIPWSQRFWAEHDCHNSFTHVYNCELEERNNKSIDFSITDNHGRCQADIQTFSNMDNDRCLLMIKCAVTWHPTCKSIGLLSGSQREAIDEVYQLCQNRTLMDYASGAQFFSPFVRAYYVPRQFELTVELLDFFALMEVRIPGLFCLTGNLTCRGLPVIQNGSKCFPYNEMFTANYPYPPFEYLFCQFENRSIDYCTNTSFFYRCRSTGECISKHRLFDGFPDCLDSSDEKDLTVLDSLETAFMKDRYNCTVNGSQATAVMRHFLGDGISQCKEGTDEMSRSINWQQKQCFDFSDHSCQLLRDLYNDDSRMMESNQVVRFTSLCNSIWDLRNGSDETDCHEWVCEEGWIKQQSNLTLWQGNCIKEQWHCNKIWDYTDGSDEWNCNYTESYPIPHCFSLKTQEIISLDERNSLAGNGRIDCLGGVDERVTFACQDGFPLNERFLCNDQVTCLQPKEICNHENNCPGGLGEDEHKYWCDLEPSSANLSVCKPKTFACQEQNDSGPCIPQDDRCHEERNSCLKSHRDKHMCIHPRQYDRNTSGRIPFPNLEQKTQSKFPPPWYCDRGLAVYRYGSVVCLCPPSFYGDRCEKHSHRLTVIFALDLNDMVANLIRIYVLLINQHEIIDYHFRSQRPTYKGKHQVYLNYPRYLYSNLRNGSNNYSVQFHLYAVDTHTVRSILVKKYPIKYSFLPAFRLAVVFKVERGSFSNSRIGDWHLNLTQSPCANGSQGLRVGNEQTICICTSQQYGPTCHLKAAVCPKNFCRNQGTCISYTNDSYRSEFRCSCPINYFGEHCEYQRANFSIDLRNEIIPERSRRVVQLLSQDITKTKLTLQRQYLMSEDSAQILYNDHQLPPVGLLKVHELGHLNIYLLYLGSNYSAVLLTERNKTKCIHAKEFDLIPKDTSQDALLSVMKRYHRPCRQQMNTTICFYDPKTYFCFCNESSRRSSCFLYDFHSDLCSGCLNGGQCIRGNLSRRDDFFCICPPCRYGRLCEINAEPFGFTLDSLIVEDSLTLQIIYLSLATLLFLIGLFTNACSIVTFVRSTPRKVGVGNYLFVAGFLNQLSLLFLLVKILSIILGTRRIAHIVFCKSIAYFLSVTTRANYWVTTWITIERLTVILLPSCTFLRNPRIAILIMIGTLLIVCGTHIHEMISYTIINYSSLCIPVFQSPAISIYNKINLIFHHLLPFLVQIVMITLLIFLAARSRAKAVGRRITLRQALRKQFHIHKELYLTPAIIVIIFSILPQSILSFSASCVELKHWQRYILLSTYFLSYLPPMLGFILQVLPSSGYTAEFKETSIGQLQFFKWMLTTKLQEQKRKDICDRSITLTNMNQKEEEQSKEPCENTLGLPSASS